MKTVPITAAMMAKVTPEVICRYVMVFGDKESRCIFETKQDAARFGLGESVRVRWERLVNGEWEHYDTTLVQMSSMITHA